MATPDRELAKGFFQEEEDYYRRGKIFDEGTVMFIQDGVVGEVVQTDTGPRILYVAQAGEITGHKSLRNSVVISPEANLQVLDDKSIDSDISRSLCAEGNIRRWHQLEEVTVQTNARQKTAYALHVLSERNSEVTVAAGNVAAWVGLDRHTVQIEYKRLREHGVISDYKFSSHGSTKEGKIEILDREYLGKVRAYRRPLAKPKR